MMGQFGGKFLYSLLLMSNRKDVRNVFNDTFSQAQLQVACFEDQFYCWKLALVGANKSA